jgi:hypothetical protein
MFQACKIPTCSSTNMLVDEKAWIVYGFFETMDETIVYCLVILGLFPVCFSVFVL